jgi:hypothetical protein
LFDAINKQREVVLLEAGDYLSALFRVNNGIDIYDLSGDRDLFGILRSTDNVPR